MKRPGKTGDDTQCSDGDGLPNDYIPGDVLRIQLDWIQQIMDLYLQLSKNRNLGLETVDVKSRIWAGAEAGTQAVSGALPLNLFAKLEFLTVIAITNTGENYGQPLHCRL